MPPDDSNDFVVGLATAGDVELRADLDLDGDVRLHGGLLGAGLSIGIVDGAGVVLRERMRVDRSLVYALGEIV